MKPEPKRHGAARPDAAPVQPDTAASRTTRRILGAATGLSLKLGLASALVVSVIIGTAAVFDYRADKQQLLGAMHEAASTQGRLLLTGLKSAMLESNRSLLTDLIDEYARTRNVERIYLVDATGAVSLTTDPSWSNRSVELPPDLCPTCPMPDNASQTRTTLTEEAGESIMRGFTVIYNEARCYRCHPAAQSFLGGLGVDFSMVPVIEALTATIAHTVRWGAAICVMVLLAVGTVVQVGALRRLRRLRDATRSLSKRTGVSSATRGRDEIGQLAHHIKTFSFTLERSIAEVDFQRQFLVGLIDRMDDGVAVFDRSLKIVAANKSYVERVSGTGTEVANTELACMNRQLCSNDETSANCPTRRAFHSNRVEKAVQKHQLEGHELVYEVFASPMADDTGSVEHVVEVWRDVTERKMIEANLAHSEQLAAVGVLASGFSHEISTPLGTVATSIQGMLRRLRGRDHLDQHDVKTLQAGLDLAYREVFRCRDITRSLLNLSRKRRTTPYRVDMASVAGRMLEVVRPTAERQQVILNSNQSPDLPPIDGHVDQLEMVMLNLYINAIEAMPDGGVLTVGLASRNGDIEIVVSDTGTGVRPQDRTRIFEPFFSRKNGGTGLGLYISRQAVEVHGGRIEVAGSSQEGTELRVLLPYQVELRGAVVAQTTERKQA